MTQIAIGAARLLRLWNSFITAKQRCATAAAAAAAQILPSSSSFSPGYSPVKL